MLILSTIKDTIYFIIYCLVSLISEFLNLLSSGLSHIAAGNLNSSFTASLVSIILLIIIGYFLAKTFLFMLKIIFGVFIILAIIGMVSYLI